MEGENASRSEDPAASRRRFRKTMMTDSTRSTPATTNAHQNSPMRLIRDGAGSSTGCGLGRTGRAFFSGSAAGVSVAAGGVSVAAGGVACSTGASGWYTLGPISVDPDWQGRGIGRALLTAGVAHWRATGAQGIVLLGSPELYRRFGFVTGSPLHLEGPLAPYFQVLAFHSEIPSATVDFAPGFDQQPRAGR